MKQNTQNKTYITKKYINIRMKIHNLKIKQKHTKHTTIYNDKNSTKNMKKCDKRKSYISSKLHIIYISSNNVRLPVTKTFTTLHPTTLNYQIILASLFFLNNQSHALIIPILFCYKTLHVSGIFSAQAESGWNCQRSLETCMKLTSTECTVENSWWWAEKMPETCRVL
jgi:hypothetical protein